MKQYIYIYMIHANIIVISHGTINLQVGAQGGVKGSIFGDTPTCACFLCTLTEQFNSTKLDQERWSHLVFYVTQ